MAPVGHTCEQRVSVQPWSRRWAHPLHFRHTRFFVPIDGAVGVSQSRMAFGFWGSMMTSRLGGGRRRHLGCLHTGGVAAVLAGHGR